MSASYLTKIEIDHETAFKAGLRDSYSWHQKIWEAFPERGGQTRNFLTRLDEIEGGLRLLILSPSAPLRPDWCPEASWHSKAVDESFFTHSTYRFSLVANPTKKVKSEKNAKNGRRIPLVKREDLLSWLQRKGEQHGFTFNLESTRTAPRPRQSFIKKGSAGLHSATEFSGVLTVTQPESFRHATLQGIGSAKAFGFGMLCLVPINEL
jgi:CRISPR system Cascade subunit CasE